MTWERENILFGIPPIICLKSDKGFKNHSSYKLYDGVKAEKCENSAFIDKMKQYKVKDGTRLKRLIHKKDRVKVWLKNASRNVSLQDMTKMFSKIQRDAGKNNDKEY